MDFVQLELLLLQVRGKSGLEVKFGNCQYINPFIAMRLVKSPKEKRLKN